MRLYVVGPQKVDTMAEVFLTYLRTGHGLEVEYIAHQPVNTTRA